MLPKEYEPNKRHYRPQQQQQKLQLTKIVKLENGEWWNEQDEICKVFRVYFRWMGGQHEHEGRKRAPKCNNHQDNCREFMKIEGKV